jgi:hypothetical protein
MTDQVCGMIARGSDHFGREPISLKPKGPRAAVAFMPRRVPSRSRAPANAERGQRGSDGGALATLRQGAWEMWRRDVRAAVRFRELPLKKPAAVSGAGFENSCDDASMPLICPTCQILTENSANHIRKIETNSAKRAAQTKKPAPVFPARAYNSCDDVGLPLICPTCQLRDVSIENPQICFSEMPAGR